MAGCVLTGWHRVGNIAKNRIFPHYA